MGAHQKRTDGLFRYRNTARALFSKKGERNPAAKLTQAIADRIRGMYQPYKVTAIELAGIFGISEKHIRQIVAGNYWNDGTYRRQGQYHHFDDTQVRQIRKLFNDGESVYALSKLYRVNKGVIHALVHGKTYKGVRT